VETFPIHIGEEKAKFSHFGGSTTVPSLANRFSKFLHAKAKAARKLFGAAIALLGGPMQADPAKKEAASFDAIEAGAPEHG
jgi:hypothetical protein